MHENNFEDRVHNKMQQLGFDPSDAVWTAVEKEINKNKRRRRPLLIILFLSGLLLAGGGIYFALIKNSSDKIIAGQTSKDNSETNNKQFARDSKPAKIQTNKSKNVISNTYDQSFVNNANVKVWTNTKDQRVVKFPKTSQSSGSDLTNAERETKTKNIQNTILPPAKPETENAGRDSYDSSLIKKEIIVVEKKDAPKDSISDLKKASPEKHKTSLWKIEFTGGIGFSDIHQSLFKQSNNSGFYTFAPINLSAGSPAPIPLSSEINTGFSFLAGLTVHRHISKRISVSAGLNYHYFSTHIHTGNAVDSPATILNSTYSSLAPTYFVNGFYQNGAVHNYTNQYHYIELPVSVNFRLNKNNKLPVYWEAGLSLSYLISTNALFFDPNGNLYYQNKELFNKTQLSGITSILMGIPLHKSEFQVGPQLQYGFTSLLKSGAVSSEHLFYGGLKISYVFGWK